MFVLLLSLIDLFANLVRYLNYEVPFTEIMRMSMFYLPKSFSYALPLSLLFAAAVFYVMEMISMMMAKLGYINPLVGAWFPVFTFTILGFFLLRQAKT